MLGALVLLGITLGLIVAPLVILDIAEKIKNK